jgi:hypothetical protein
MKKYQMRTDMRNRVSLQKRGMAGVLVILLTFIFSALASAQEEDTWQNELTVYGWYAGIDGDVQVASGPGFDLSIDTSEILDDLNMIFMGEYRGQYGKWSIIADVIYIGVDGSADKPLLLGAHSVKLDMTSWIVEGGVGYNIVESRHGTLAVVGGARYLDIDVDVKLGILGDTIIKKSGSDGLLDGIIGISGYIALTDNWYLPYHADIGTGSSDLTWQVFGGIGYRFDWGNIRLGYRYLSYDLDNDTVMKDLSISGPIMGVGITF